MNDKKSKILMYLCIVIFGALGIYLTFISGIVNKYDGEVSAYRIEPNEQWDSDSTLYYPIYYFKVKGKEYTCESKSGSSTYPKESKNKVYYDSSNPQKCKTQYEKSSSSLVGIICLVVTAIMIVFAVKKPSSNSDEYSKKTDEIITKINENTEKISSFVNKFQLIYKRIIIGIIIVVLLVITIFDTALIKQTIKSKDYVETNAILVDKKNDDNSDIFNEYIYSFEDKHGKKQEIIVSISKDDEAQQEITIKYDENNPQEYYEEGSILDESGIIWYVVKVIVIILLVILFFNKKLLSKINISMNG